jgi:hypothetical protein
MEECRVSETVSVWEEGKFLKMDGGDGCTT